MALGWAMVGTGAHVRNRMAPAARHAEDTRLVAVCSREAARAQEYAGTFGFEQAFDDYAAVLRDDRVDVVYLATPNHLHAEQTIQAAQAGKHVLVEKPMALTVADAEAMVAACRAHGVKLGVGFHLRYHPAHTETRRLLDEGLLGQPQLLQLQWVGSGSRRGGWWADPAQVGAYATMGLGVHLIDLLFYLTGRQPQQVMAMTNGQRPDRPLEDTALALLRLSDDVFGSLLAGRRLPHAESTLTVYGSSGYLRTTGTLSTDATGTLELVTGAESRRISYQGRNPYQAEIEAFNRSIREDLEPNASGLDGLRTVRVTVALLESARRRQAVALAEPSAV